MILSDASLRALYPEHADGIQPSSLDLHLGGTLLRLPYGQTLDPERDQSELWQETPLAHDGRWWLGQGGLYLAATRERIAIPPDRVGLLHGVSSLGRLGLLVHVTAGLIDSGWCGNLTLELVSLGGTILLRPGQRVAQITLHALDAMPERVYAGRYQHDTRPQPSRSFLDLVGVAP